jgi:hypothetical protein
MRVKEMDRAAATAEALKGRFKDQHRGKPSEGRPHAVRPEVGHPPTAGSPLHPKGVSRVVSSMSSVRNAVSARVDAPARLATARERMNAEAARLGSVRDESHECQQQRVDARLIDIICRELSIELEGEGRRPAANSDFPARRSEALQALEPSAKPTLHPQAVAALRARSAMQLIEKIERFVKSQRPSLALTLNSELAARVEVERTGPGEVAIKLMGRNGPPAPEDVSRIRDEIRLRGLKLSALSVG